MAEDFISQKEASFSSLESRFYPTLNTSLEGVLESLKANIEVCIPCIVKSVNRAKNTVIVAYAPNIKTSYGGEDNSNLPRGSIEVPILVASGGGFMVNFPISKGDVGWVLAGDRDTTGYREDNSKRYNLFSLGTHQYNYGVFMPDVFSAEKKTFTLTEGDNGKFVIQTLDGKTKIRLGHDNTIDIRTQYGDEGETRISLKGGEEDTEGHGVITIVCPNTLKISGNVDIVGNVSVTGGITTTEDVIANDISLDTHTHPCPHGGDTGQPNAS